MLAFHEQPEEGSPQKCIDDGNPQAYEGLGEPTKAQAQALKMACAQAPKSARGALKWLAPRRSKKPSGILEGPQQLMPLKGPWGA